MFRYPLYQPSQTALEILVGARAINSDDDPQSLIERIIDTICRVETRFNTDLKETQKFADEFAQILVDGYFMPGMPTLVNAGRNERALSSCVVIPVNLLNKVGARKTILSYYKQNMGSGFDFTDYENPVILLKWLNELCIHEAATGYYDRFIGNMGTLHITHPRIQEFVAAKRLDSSLKHFNISVDISESFMSRALAKESFTLSDGSSLRADHLLQTISENAWGCGEPGIIFLERMNKDNPIVDLSAYVSTPPCGEMGLAAGETCQFGYINLSKFIEPGLNGTPTFNYGKLADVTRLAVRVLDNAIEYGLSFYPTQQTIDITRLKRKIGIGVCGLADVLINLDTPYDSPEAIRLARDILSCINFVSKQASVDLAEQRGSCLAMMFPEKNNYLKGFFLESKYGVRPTRTISSAQWNDLAQKIQKTAKLRNILTTALPPTYRISRILGTTPSIEPIFNIYEDGGGIKRNIINLLDRKITNKAILDEILKQAQRDGNFQSINSLPTDLRECLKTATEISIAGHINMIAELAGVNGVVDEAASKTVNLSSNVSIDDVKSIFVSAYQLGIKCISVYRNNAISNQPEKLS